MLLVRAFSVSEDPDGEVFDVRGPLSRQLEKLHVVPLDTINQYSQHGLLLLGSADEPADALDHLTLGLHLLVFALFWQEHDLLILLLGHHSHGHGGLGARLCAPQWQPADLQRAEIALQSVFGGGVPLLHVFLPLGWSHPVVHLKPHQLRLSYRTVSAEGGVDRGRGGWGR